MEFRDYYDILGVKRTASADEIKRAYRRLARKFHPDVSSEADADEKFKAVNEAYEVLKDPEKRTAYDNFGEHWEAGQDWQPPPDWAQEFNFKRSAGESEFSDFFESLFGGGTTFSNGGFARRGGRRRMDGEDINASICIPIEDAYNGATRQISLDMPEIDGYGRTVQKRRTLNVTIPKGVKAGQRIRLEDQGVRGSGTGARSGHLYLKVEFESHPLFEVRGRDVFVTLPITPAEAVLGATVKAPTLGGPVDLKIPSGSSTGRRLRLKGRGLPGSPCGDQYVELKIVVPDHLDSESRAIYEELARREAFNPRADMGV